MKPSGPGLLFAGRFLITVSISVLVMGLLRFSISSWSSFGNLYFIRICPFFPRCPFYWHIIVDSTLLWSFVSLCCLLFFWYEDCYSNLFFFCFQFAWNIFFHLLTFSLYVSLCLKLVSCRQHIYGSSFIHSASLCLLVGAFNPFTFKVIIDIYVPIAIFLIVLGWLCRSFFFSCISWL